LRPASTLSTDLTHQRELIDAAIAVNEAPTLEEAFQVLAETGLALVGADRLTVVVWDEDLGKGIVRAAAGTAVDAIGEQVPADPHSLEALLTGRPVVGGPRPEGLSLALRDAIAGMTTVVRVGLSTESCRATFNASWADALAPEVAIEAGEAVRTLTQLTSLAERSLREREQTRLSSVLERVADGVVVSSASHASANAAARAILAIPDDVEFKTSLFAPRTLEGTPYEISAGSFPGQEASERDVTARFRLRATALDGRELVLDGSVSPLPDGAVIVFRDVTAEHEREVLNERYLYALFNSMPIPLTVGYAKTREFISANQAFLDLVGYELDEIVGVQPPFPWWDSGEDSGAGFEHGSVVQRVYRRKDGRPVAVEVLSHGIPGDDGEVVLLLGVITDLSEKRRVDQQLVQSGKLAAIGELAAGVAHEINNPLFAILGLTEFLLNEAEPGSKAQQRLELIQQTGLEIKEIVRALLDFARENAEERHVVPLEEVVQSTVDLVRRTNAHKGIELVDDYDGSGALVYASPNQLKQIILNLIANARQAMPNGGTVRVHVHRDGDFVCANVEDDGQGIEPAVIHRIFEPFFTTKRSAGGTGLGLSVSIGIAEAHGGTLTAASELGQGATFSLRLPVATEEEVSP
jgi:PAS domain S-box-containing protein